MKNICNGLLGSAVLAAFVMHFPAGESAHAKERTVYSFCSQPQKERYCTDGDSPFASLIDVNGTLYGTTGAGGELNGGTVFSLNPRTGIEKPVYSFCSQPKCVDGAGPGGVIAVNGMLYGTTVRGGAGRHGTVFSIDLNTGTEKVLHSFCDQQVRNCTDGIYPYAGLIAVNGTLFGTTFSGGGQSCYNSYNGYGCGTVFSIDPSTGVEKVLYAFCRQTNCADGRDPGASLIDVKGILYGTAWGGKHGGGVVFSLDPRTGVEKVLYSFCRRTNCTDGYSPDASLIDVNGTLYGTTAVGGKYAGGVVFSLDSRIGAERVLYSFCRQTRCTDGKSPLANLIEDQGILYGTTEQGGSRNEHGGGTVFALNPETGAETVVYSFCRSRTDCRDGYYPDAGLFKLKDWLYGTTREGGSSYKGAVFAIRP